VKEKPVEPTETPSAWQLKYRIESAQEQVDAGAKVEERLVELRRLAGVR
jgi:hypothetical protein